MEDIINNKYNRLTVLEKSNKKSGSSYLYLCECECGNLTYATKTALQSGHKKSCGCLHTEQRSQLGKSKKKNLIGQVFGHLTVIRETSERKDGKVVWECKCECGNTILRSSRDLRVGQLHCGCLTVHSLGEQKVKTLLQENNIIFSQEKIYPDLKLNGKYLRYDFFVNNLYLIEYDGRQHFIQSTGYGEELEKIQERDNIKNNYAISHNIPLIRIPYTDYNKFTFEDLNPLHSKYLVKRSD